MCIDACGAVEPLIKWHIAIANDYDQLVSHRTETSNPFKPFASHQTLCECVFNFLYFATDTLGMQPIFHTIIGWWGYFRCDLCVAYVYTFVCHVMSEKLELSRKDPNRMCTSFALMRSLCFLPLNWVWWSRVLSRWRICSSSLLISFNLKPHCGCYFRFFWPRCVCRLFCWFYSSFSSVFSFSVVLFSFS